jgi:hypothetical protein
VWVAYVKRQIGIATQMSMFKVKVTVAKNRNSISTINLSLLWPVDARLSVWVAYNKRQLGIATRVSVIKVNVTAA